VPLLCPINFDSHLMGWHGSNIAIQHTPLYAWWPAPGFGTRLQLPGFVFYLGERRAPARMRLPCKHMQPSCLGGGAVAVPAAVVLQAAWAASQARNGRAGTGQDYVDLDVCSLRSSAI